MSNTEPNNFVYETILKHSPLVIKRKNDKRNKSKFIYFIDDLNLSFKCNKQLEGLEKNQLPSANMELARQIFETNNIYCKDNQNFMQLTEMNFILTCSYPGKSPNLLPLPENLTKNLISINLYSDEYSQIESVFRSPIQHWLEEFPSYLVYYPIEITSVNYITI